MITSRALAGAGLDHGARAPQGEELRDALLDRGLAEEDRASALESDHGHRRPSQRRDHDIGCAVPVDISERARSRSRSPRR